ncbi:MAG: hypothetical protein WC889_15450 [Myxococcota bacterium]|jgi:hypothetical protein
MTHLNSNSRWNLIELLVKGAASAIMLSIILFSFNAKAEQHLDGLIPLPAHNIKSGDVASDMIPPLSETKKPGDKLRLASRVVGGISIGTLILGGSLMVTGAALSNNRDPNEVCHMVCDLSGLDYFIFGAGVLGLGVATGITSLGLYLGAEAKDREGAKRIEISPYINPVIKKNEASASASLDGAVVGLKGTF